MPIPFRLVIRLLWASPDFLGARLGMQLHSRYQRGTHTWGLSLKPFF